MQTTAAVAHLLPVIAQDVCILPLNVSDLLLLGLHLSGSYFSALGTSVFYTTMTELG